MANVSRNSFDESKGYDKVILQQGVPITDYDFNESQDIQRYKLRRIIKELFGDGAIGDGFKVVPTATASQSVVVKAGTLYVSGWRIVNTADYTIGLPAAPGTGTRTDYIWVECAETEIDSVMDPSIKHDKLSIEPTRRTKVGYTIRTGTAVPADTDTVKNYTIANITRAANDNVIQAGEITDARSVKITFEGAGFSVKGSATLGDEATDIIDIQGTVKNTSNSNGGKVKIDDSVQIVNDLDVGGYVKTTGINVQTGKYYEVARIPLFGIAGDIQYQSDVTAWEDVTASLYNLFSLHASRIPTVPTGATRKYKLAYSWSSDSATGIVEVRLCSIDTTVIAVSTTQQVFQGALDGSRMYYLSNAFDPPAAANHWKVQAKTSAGNFSIMYVELIAYDVY